MTGRRPNSTLVWNFYNSFREAQCPDTVVGEYLLWPVSIASLCASPAVSLSVSRCLASLSLSLCVCRSPSLSVFLCLPLCLLHLYRPEQVLGGNTHRWAELDRARRPAKRRRGRLLHHLHWQQGL